MKKAQIKQIYYETVANTIIKNLNRRQMEGFYCSDKTSALSKVLELIPEGASVGWGGSVTLEEIGVIDVIQKCNYKIINKESPNFFLMSTNAITLEGELINIDGKGNRVAFLCYGPQNVLIITGMNKVVTDIESGIKRTRDIAAPPNAIRLKRQTPCSITGKCENCYSLDCMCGQFVVTRRSGIPNRIKVILVGEELGY